MPNNLTVPQWYDSSGTLQTAASLTDRNLYQHTITLSNNGGVFGYGYLSFEIISPRKTTVTTFEGLLNILPEVPYKRKIPLNGFIKVNLYGGGPDPGYYKGLYINYPSAVSTNWTFALSLMSTISTSSSTPAVWGEPKEYPLTSSGLGISEDIVISLFS